MDAFLFLLEHGHKVADKKEALFLRKFETNDINENNYQHNNVFKGEVVALSINTFSATPRSDKYDDWIFVISISGICPDTKFRYG